MRPETRHSLVLTIGTGSTALLSLVYSVYAGRTLGPDANGDFVAALFIALICNIALGPINGTVTKFAAQFAGNHEYGQIRALHGWFLRRVLGYETVGLAIALLLLRPFAAALRFQSLWPLLAAYVIVCLTLLVSTGRGVLRGVQAFRAYNVNIVAEAALRLAVGALLLTLAQTAGVGLLAYVIGLVAVLALLAFQVRPIWGDRTPEPLDTAAIRRFVAPMFVLMATSAGLEYVDLLVAKRVFSRDNAGVYGAACVLTRAISVVATPFHVLMLPTLAQLYAQGQPLAGTFLRVSSYFLLLAVAPLALFMLCPTAIMRLTYGEEFVGAAPLLFPLAAARVLCYVGAMVALFFAATGRFRFLAVYVPALALEIVLLSVWHATLGQLVLVVLIAQALALVLVCLYGMTNSLVGRPSTR